MMKKLKTGGRKKGTPNKVTRDLRESITALVEKNLKTIEADFKQLEPEKRLVVLERYLKYCLPPLQSMSIQADIKQQLEKLTDEELGELAEKIISQTIINEP